MRSGPISRVRTSLALATVVLGLHACTDDPTHRRPVAVLTETTGDTAPAALPWAPEPRTAGGPTATLRNDTRPVLRGYREVRLARVRRTLSGRAEAVIEGTVPAPLAAATRIAFRGQVRTPTGWQPVPPGAVAVDRSSGAPRFRATIQAMPVLAGKPVDVLLHAVPLPAEPVSVIARGPVEVDDGMEMSLAIGVLPRAASWGPVVFRVLACQADECQRVFEDTALPHDARTGWKEHRFALPLAAGTWTFLFETDANGGIEPSSLPVWGDPVITQPRTGARPPNVVVISLDTLRADHLEPWGYDRPTSPFLRELAKESTLLEHAVAPSTTTDPSHMTLFTGLTSSIHGVIGGLTTLTVPTIMLADLFRASGWATGAFTENGPLAHERGFARGFGTWVENKSPAVLDPTGQIERTFGQALQWMDEHRDQPFFAFVHTFQVHAPYTPPRAYEELVDPVMPELPEGPEQRAADHERNYDREIRFTDDQLRRLLGWMKETGLAENTIVVLTADHGEAFLEHGDMGHGVLPYEEVLHIPMMVRGPGIGTSRVATPVWLGDLGATVLELAGLRNERDAASLDFPGRSFAGLLRGDSGATHREIVVSQAWVQPEGVTPPSTTLRRGTQKLLRYTRDGEVRIELYDLKTDPGERTDLAPSQPALRDELTAALDTWEREARAESDRRSGRDATTTTRPPAQAPPEAVMDPEREKMLRALGYIE